MMYRPGDTVPVSGIYNAVTSYGAYAGFQRTCVEGEPFPPLVSPAYGFVLSQATQH